MINKYFKLIYGKANIDPKIFTSYPKALLSLLQEYRTRLVSDVVTGRVNVQGVEVPEFEAEAENADLSGIGRETEGDVSDGYGLEELIINA